jgi:hypothetical protein
MANRYLIEKCLVEHCSATLASMKSANLFNMTFADDTDVEDQIEFWNRCMKEKGIRLYILRRQENRVLVYVYRKKQLEVSLNRPGVAKFLKKYGYGSTDVEYALDRLKSRIGENNEFPHEIGIFLDYPLGDVIGFITNEGLSIIENAGLMGLPLPESICQAIDVLKRHSQNTIEKQT